MEEQFNNEQEQPQVFQVMIVIDEAHIADYIYASLIDKGLVPTEEEASVLGEIVFDYLLDMGMIEDYEDYEQDEE